MPPACFTSACVTHRHTGVGSGGKDGAVGDDGGVAVLVSAASAATAMFDGAVAVDPCNENKEKEKRTNTGT